MTSFEEADASRADFNRPYSCVTVKPDGTSVGLAKLEPGDWATPAIAWFDFDDPFTESVAGDCRRLLQNLSAGSVLLISVNVNRRLYKSSGSADKGPLVVETLRARLGSALTWSGETGDIAEADFPNVARASILAFLSKSLRETGRDDGLTPANPLLFAPLFDLLHVDSALMATVGGMLVRPSDLKTLADVLGVSEPKVMDGSAALRETLDLVPITPKEKIALDRLMPCEAAKLEQTLAAAGLPLQLETAEKYRRFYPHYPLFAETLS